MTHIAPIRCTVVGAGWAGTRLARAAAELESEGGPAALRIVSLVDPDADQRRAVARELGVDRTHGTLEAALDTDVDAVLVCTPHALHAPQTLLSIAAGRHVLVEKPMALDLADADRMVVAAEAAGVVLGVAENEVYEPWVMDLHRRFRVDGEVGELAFAVVVSGQRTPALAYPGRRAWLSRPDDGGTGSWMLHGIHTVAVARSVLGPFTSVYAREHRTSAFARPDLEATMSLLVTLTDGTPVSLIQTPEVDPGADRRIITLYGDQAVLEARESGWSTTRAADGSGARVLESGPAPQGRRSSYAAELAAFAAAIRGGPGMRTSGRSERDSLAVVLAALESVRTGAPVRLDPLAEGPPMPP